MMKSRQAQAKKQVNTWVEPVLKERIDRLKETKGVNTSEEIRRAIMERVAMLEDTLGLPPLEYPALT